MSLGELILADVRLSARRAHGHFRAGNLGFGRPPAERIALLPDALRSRHDTDAPFDQMVREVVRLGLPEAFVADLFVHDRRRLEMMAAEDGPLRFVWVLYDCGTHLLEARGSLTPSYLAEPFIRRYDRCHVYLFEGGRLTECARRPGARGLRMKP